MVLPEYEAKHLLSEKGIDVVPAEKIESLTNLEASGEYFGFPVVLKLSSSRYSHKTEIGGVILGIENYNDLEKAYVRLDDIRRRIDPDSSIIIEPMIRDGIEFFAGIKRHRNFGLVISFGLGGIFLELIKDVSFRLIPALSCDYAEMVSELKCWPKLKEGFRGYRPVEIEKVVDVLEKIGEFASAEPDLVEMDLNPITYTDGRFVVVDARIVKRDK